MQYLGPRGQGLLVSYCEKDDGAPMILWALTARSEGPPAPDENWHLTLLALIRSGERAADRLPLRTTRLAVPRARLPPTITSLGDAAHAMPLRRGLGGNEAFEEARRLCDGLDDVAGYERELIRRGKRRVEESEEVLELLGFTGPRAWLRDAVLRVIAKVR